MYIPPGRHVVVLDVKKLRDNLHNVTPPNNSLVPVNIVNSWQPYRRMAFLREFGLHGRVLERTEARALDLETQTRTPFQLVSTIWLP